MRHSINELLDVVYRFYPRDSWTPEAGHKPGYDDTEENRRLVAARRRAAVDERWHAMRRSISERFPDAPLMNHSLHLPAGALDACYSFTISPPEITGHQLWFQVSFLAPYYIIFSSRLTESDIVTSPVEFKFIFRGVPVHFPGSAINAGLLLNPDDESLKSVTIQQQDVTVTFDLSPDERPYAEWIAREIEATFDCERMPPEVGTVLVPDVTTTRRTLGEARLYDCLFSDDHQWVKPLASEVRAPALEIDANRLTDRSIAVITVLAALYQIAWTLIPKTHGAVCGMVWTDGILHKEEVLESLAWIRPLIESPVTPRGIAARGELEGAARELGALIAAWDGEGAPPDAMVAWASSFLTNWVVDESSE